MTWLDLMSTQVIIIVVIIGVIVVIAAGLLMIPMPTERTISEFDADKVPTGFLDTTPSEKELAEFVDTSTSEKDTTKNCDSAYPDVCITSYPPDLDCDEISYSNFKVVGNDPW